MKYLRLFCLLICICFSCSSYCFCTVYATKATKAPKATKSPKSTKEPVSSPEPSASSASASPAEFKLENDGNEKSAKDVYKDTNITSSFKDVKYYDCWIPYNLTCEDIGGYITDSGVQGGENMTPMKDSIRKSKVCSTVMRETSIKSKSPDIRTWLYDGKPLSQSLLDRELIELDKHSKIKYKDDMVVYENKKGVEFYFTAVQPWFYSNTKSLDLLKGGTELKEVKGAGYNGIGFGHIFDVILTDGTCIHFIYFDTNAAAHTNGGATDQSKAAELNKKQYKCLFSSKNGNSLELVCENTKGQDTFTSKYFKKGVHIAYYRMYNKTALDDVEAVSDEAKSVSYNVTGGNTSGGSGNNDNKKNAENIANNAVSLNGFYSEGALSNFVKLQEVYLTDMLDNANKDALGQDDLSNLSNWNMNKSEDKGEGFVIKVTRKITMVLGIILTVYAVLIYIAFWFDRTNIFMDIDVLGVLTFGRMSAIMDDTDSNYKRDMDDRNKKLYVDSKSITKIVLLVVSFGALIISGVIFGILLKLVNLIFGLIQGF